jgi:hypothetical protein
MMKRLLAGLMLLGCHHGAPKPVCDGVSGLVVTRVVEHPGGGDEITARLRFASGVPIAEADLVECLSVQGAPASIASRTLEASFTLLLIDPGATRRETDNTRALVDALLKKRPATEPIALFRWGASVTQMAPFNSDRRFLQERLSAGLVPADTVLPATAALAAAAAALTSTGGPAVDALRTIVLVSPRNAAAVGLAAALEGAQPHLVLWLGGTEQERQWTALPAGQRFPVSGQTMPALVVSALSDRLDAYQRHAHYAVGLCGQGQRALRLNFREGETAALTLPAPLPENGGGACVAEELAEGRRRFPAHLALSFTPEERAAAAMAFADRDHRPSFGLGVRVAAEGTPVAATARYRGRASYDCARRSYSLALDGDEPRFLFPGSAARRFELVAMCLDRLYLRSYTVLRLLASEGLFPVPFDLIELEVDGVSQGPYLIFEDPGDSLRTHSSRLSSVVRRAVSPDGAGTAPEVRWSATNEADARAAYDLILGGAMGLEGRRLEDALDDHFDLQGYLTWVALMNLVGSGGYADQLLFYAAETTAADGTAAPYHLLAGWDEDDLFAGCRAGARAIFDPRGLVTCAETELDRRIFTDSLLYPRYAEVLSAVLERQPPERFAGFAREAATRVLSFLEQPAARAGLVELAALDPQATTSFEVARRLLEDELALLLSQFEHRHATLEDRLARFRGER